MELKLTKNTPYGLDTLNKWSIRAAAWMGLSFFLRMVYYFGLMNLRDLSGGVITFSVVLPLIISVAFILILKLPNLPKVNSPIIAASLSIAFAVNYFLTERMSFGGVLSGLLVLVVAGLTMAAVLGYAPERIWLLRAAMVSLGFRVLFVDLFGYLLPLSQLSLVAYIPIASNLFGATAVCFLCAGLNSEEI